MNRLEANWNRIMILIVLLLGLIHFVSATPNAINLQGRLTSSSGSIQTGTFNFTFRIYDNFTSGTMLYETNLSLTTDSRGIYDAILTNINLPFNTQYYLAVKVMGDSEMQPRVNLTSVPYSFKANESEGLNTSKDATVNGNINLTNAGNINAAGTINANILNALSQLNINGGFSNGGLTINSNGDIVTYGDILFSGNISVVNVTYLSVNGTITPGLDNLFDFGNGSLRWRNANFSGMVQLGALAVDNNTLFVDGVNHRVGIGTTNPANTLTVQGTLNVTAQNTRSGDLFVASNGFVGIGTSTPNSNLVVVGGVNISGGLNVTGDVNITGNFYTTGNTVLGSSSSNTVAVNGQVASDLVPNNNARSLGSATNFWHLAFVDQMTVSNLTTGSANISGTQFPAFTLNANYTGNDNQDVSLVFERGTPITNAVLFWDSTNKRFDFNFPLNIEANQNLTVDTNSLFVDGSIHKVGINTSVPAQTLTILGTLNVTSQNTRSGDLFVASNGFVGINQTNPSSKFEVAGTANITSGSSQFLVNSNGNVVINLKG